MSGISMAGMGTGLDIYGMAQQMATAQIQPKANQLTKKETAINGEIAALNELSSSLNSFYNTIGRYSDPTSFGALHVQMAEDDEKFATVSVDETALPSTYQLQVDQLATQHKVQAFTDTVADGEEPTVPAGEYTFAIDGEEMTITVEEDANSFSEVVSQVNDHPDNPGITASMMSNGNTSYLTLTSDETGAASEITMSHDDDPPVLQKAQDAEFTIDGIPMTSSDNTVDDVLPGVTISLKSVTDEPIRFEIQPDTSTMTSSVNAIVDSFNEVLKTLDSLSKSTLDETTGERYRPPLASDPMINSVRTELRAVLQTEFEEPFTSLASIGIITDRNGELEVDSEALQEALDEDPNAVNDMFMDVIDGWEDVVTKYIGRPEEEEDDEDGSGTVQASSPSTSSDKYIPADGLIDARVENLERDLRAVDDEWSRLETRYESVYQRYLNEYIAMDMAVAQMNMSLGGLLI
ncbi:MAG: flagellar filament capping protein FliD [Endozoicomonas sp.]